MPGSAAVHVSKCGSGPSTARTPGQVGFGRASLETAALPQQALRLVSVEGITPFLPKSSLPKHN